jgi:hypothetical protein
MRRDALAGELKSSALPGGVRLQYEKELMSLDGELSGISRDIDFLFESPSVDSLGGE